MRPPGGGIGGPVRPGPDGPGRRGRAIAFIGCTLAGGRRITLHGFAARANGAPGSIAGRPRPLRFPDGRGPGRSRILPLGTGDASVVRPGPGVAAAARRGHCAAAVFDDAALIAAAGGPLAGVGPDRPAARPIVPDGRPRNDIRIPSRLGSAPVSRPEPRVCPALSQAGRGQGPGRR